MGTISEKLFANTLLSLVSKNFDTLFRFAGTN